ncbi:hypothetical protein FKW77_004088 [Venturia effusa]|uniref:Heterokaryon incompatibility domain-containing protein n=1 Tax=Venturia effusa TaxID=50376 RepID=A0A517LC62_9PEZI|nr:hypothetical protein FKW77_004088 [Venturia effusa]
MSSHTYQPLGGDTDQIRLAILDCKDDGIHIELQTHSLANVPPYFALSYAWGDDKVMRSILVDDCILAVRLNLWDGLHGLKASASQLFEKAGGSQTFGPLANELSSITVWIDALCINQSDNSERSHQVRLMGDIYKRASCVVSYLGPVSEDSDEAMRALAQIPNDHYGTVKDYWWADDKKFRRSMTKLLSRPYWTRLWVVQEFKVAAQNLILCGTFVLEWSKLYYFDKLIWEFVDSDLEITKTPACWFIGSKEVGGPPFEPSYHLWSAVTFYSTKICADPRDKIYGLLALVDFRGEPPIEADYSLSTEEVYQIFCAYVRRAPDLEGRYQRDYMEACRETMGLDVEKGEEMGEDMGEKMSVKMDI